MLRTTSDASRQAVSEYIRTVNRTCRLGKSASAMFWGVCNINSFKWDGANQEVWVTPLPNKKAQLCIWVPEEWGDLDQGDLDALGTSLFRRRHNLSEYFCSPVGDYITRNGIENMKATLAEERRLVRKYVYNQ